MRASPTNWFGVELWPAIDKVAKSCGFHTCEMVKVLRSGVGGDVYQPLSAGSIERWIARDSQGSSLRRWKDLVLTKVANGGSRDIRVPCLGRPSAMVEFFFYFEKNGLIFFKVGYPSLVNRIRKDLEVNRNSGVPISVPVARVLILGYVQTMAPKLIASHAFKCSSTFMCHFLSNQLHWSWRTGTHAAQKTPENWENLCEDAFLPIVYHAMWDGILPKAMINGDQLGVRLVPLGNKTWAPYGAKQVAVYGKEEKRQFTLMVTMTCSGEILPFQCIYKGQTKNSLPSQSVRVEAEKAGFVFSCGGDTHWSNLDCVKEVSLPFFL